MFGQNVVLGLIWYRQLKIRDFLIVFWEPWSHSMQDFRELVWQAEDPFRAGEFVKTGGFGTRNVLRVCAYGREGRTGLGGLAPLVDLSEKVCG